MEPVTVVLTALAAGAVTGFRDVVGTAVKDTYDALKGLVSRRVSDQPLGEELVAQYEQAPDVWEGPLRAALLAAKADQDPEVLRLAERLRELTAPAAPPGGTYQVTVEGNVQGLAQGDRQHVDMRFHEPPHGA